MCSDSELCTPSASSNSAAGVYTKGNGTVNGTMVSLGHNDQI